MILQGRRHAPDLHAAILIIFRGIQRRAAARLRTGSYRRGIADRLRRRSASFARLSEARAILRYSAVMDGLALRSAISREWAGVPSRGESVETRDRTIRHKGL
jgi:hypothetical protein